MLIYYFITILIIIFLIRNDIYINYKIWSYQVWLKNNKYHRENGPARIFSNGDLQWFIDGKLHRDNGPARTFSNGDQQWFINGKLHRENGPAAIYQKDNVKCRYIMGKIHRLDGPAYNL